MYFNSCARCRILKAMLQDLISNEELGNFRIVSKYFPPTSMALLGYVLHEIDDEVLNLALSQYQYPVWLYRCLNQVK